MSRRLVFILLVIGSLLVASAAFAQEEHGPAHWTYEGEEGPGHWGEISPDYAKCVDGSAQSPINVTHAQDADLVDIAFDYGSTNLNILNNGHTIQVNADAGSSITYNEVQFNLLQFHFHDPSEHEIDGAAAPMEMHLVHANAVGDLAVVGVMLVEGAENPAFADVFNNLPAEEGEAPVAVSVDLSALLPADQHFFTYGGSLTTPPCSENVRWLLLDTPVELSHDQIAAFAAIIHDNARPVQPLNTRDLFHDAS